MKHKKYTIFSLAYLIVTLPVFYLSLLIFHQPIASLCVYSLLTIIMILLSMHLYSIKTISTKRNEIATLYAILDDVNAFIIIWSPDLSVFNVNNSLFDRTGFDKSDIRDKSLIQKLINIKISDLKNIAESEIIRDRETILNCPNGLKLSVAWKTNLIQNDKKTKIYMSVGIDLTEMKYIQNELSVSENRYQLSMELSEIGLIFRNVGSASYYLSKNICDKLGFNSQTVSAADFVEKIHPADKTVFETYYKSAELNSKEDIHKVTSIELRLLDQNGFYCWYNYRYKISDGIADNSMAIGGTLIDITKDKEKDTLIEKMAYIDEVTQIYNRNKFMLLGQETFTCSKELGISYWLIVLDVDKFHIINDTCGYKNGNILLKEIAITILRNISDGGFCARIGGDNFAILLKDIGDENYPKVVIQEIQTSIASLTYDVFSNQTITASAGYCKLPGDGNEFSQVLEHAEFAIRLGQEQRSNIVQYDNNVHDKIIGKTVLEKELKKALKNNELKLFYQPKINLSTNKLMGVEALIRWIKPDGTIIPPNSFIPIAETSSLITKISEFVVNEACRQNKQWQDMGLPCFNVSVNLSSVDFYQTVVCKTIKDALDHSGLSPKHLEIELTESLALKDVEQAVRQMNELKQIGVQISMDDFGTGYSSLSYIQVLPITLLKLDRSFIMYLEEDEISREIVSSVINICKSKKIEIIAEGIETLGQAEILKKSGCDHAQGYYFGKPMCSGDLENFIRKAN